MRHILWLCLALTPFYAQAQAPADCQQSKTSYDQFDKSMTSGGAHLGATDPTCFSQLKSAVEAKDDKVCFQRVVSVPASPPQTGTMDAAVSAANAATHMAQLYDQTKNNCDMYHNWVQYKCTKQQDPVVQAALKALDDSAKCNAGLRDAEADKSGQARQSLAQGSGQYQVANLAQACYLAICLLANGVAVEKGVQQLNLPAQISVTDAPTPNRKQGYVAP